MLVRYLKFICISDESARYGEAFRRAAIRSACYSQRGILLVLMVINEQDPTRTCVRRTRGQITCPELSCVMCHLNALNIASADAHHGLGSIIMLFIFKLKLHDRHRILSVEHGACRPSDVDWEEMDKIPTGQS